MNILQIFIVVLIVVLVIAYLLSSISGDFYQKLFGGGTWTDLRGIIGLPLTYIFFLPLLFTAFGDKYKYWWIGILLIPALWFEISFDLPHLYFSLLLCLLGWGIGFVFSRKLLRHRGLNFGKV